MIKNLFSLMAAVDEINNKISNIESSLKSIEKQTGGFKSSAGESFNEGIKNILNKIGNNTTAVKNLENAIVNGKNNDNSRNLGNEIGNIAGNLKTIADSFTGTNNIGGKIDKLNSTIEAALQSLSNNHVNNAASNTKNGASSNAPLNNIDKNVEQILVELKAIKDNILSKKIETEDEDLKKLLSENATLKAKRENTELKRNEALEEAKREYYEAKKSGDKSKIKEAKSKYKDEFNKKQKEDEEIKKIEKRKGEGTAKAFKSIAGEITSFLSEKPSASKLADKGIGAISNLGPGGAIAGSILSVLKGLFDLGAKQDRATTEYARIIGGNNQAKYNIGDTVSNINRGWDRKGMYGGYRAEDAYSALTEYAATRGRTIERTSAESIRSLIDLKRFGIGMESINNFDTFGKSLEQTDKYFAKLYNDVSKKGLSFKNVSKAVNDNLKAAQSHTFANGLRGLEQMAERSVQLKYNMQQVFQFADKVSEVEGAISTAANLSVLGGEFAQYSNPMQLLYEGLNDSEALQKRMEGMFGNKAFWNSQTKQIDMSAMDKEFMKQAAKAAGLDANEMLNISYNNARLKRIEGQIGPGLSQDTVNYIKNIAELDENGNGYVNIGGQNKLVSQLSESDRELLQKESDLKDRGDNAKLGDIYMTTSNIGENIDNLASYIQERLGQWVFQIFQTIAKRENNRQNIVANSTKDENLLEKRMQYYNEHSLEYSGFWGGRKRFAEKIANGGFDYNLQGKSPMGFSPINGLIKGGSHLYGGVKGILNGKPWEAEGNEWLINKLSSMRYGNILSKIQNGTFNPYSYANDLIKNNMDKHLNSMQVAPVQTNQAVSNVVPNSPNAMLGRFKIDIPETITIKLENGTDIGNLDTKVISSIIIPYIMKEWGKMKNLSGFDKEGFAYKNVIG